MSSYRHSIEEVIVDLHFGNKRDAHLVLKSTENLILEACSAVLDEFNFGFPLEDIEFSIDAIDINVKEIKLDVFSHEFPKRIVSEIRTFLKKSIFPQIGSIRMKEGKDGVNHESILAYCMEVYLVHGGLPRWMKRSAPSLLKEYILNYPTSSNSLVLKHRSNETALYRMCEMMDATTYVALIQNLTRYELGLENGNEIDQTYVPEETKSKVVQLIAFFNSGTIDPIHQGHMRELKSTDERLRNADTDHFGQSTSLIDFKLFEQELSAKTTNPFSFEIHRLNENTFEAYIFALEQYIRTDTYPHWMTISAEELFNYLLSNSTVSMTTFVQTLRKRGVLTERLLQLVTYSNSSVLFVALNSANGRQNKDLLLEVLDAISSPQQFESVKQILIEDALNTKGNSTSSHDRLKHVLSEINSSDFKDDLEKSQRQKVFDTDLTDRIEELFNKVKFDDVTINSLELIGLLKYVNREHVGLNYFISELGISEFKLLLKRMHIEFYNWYNAEEHQYLREFQLRKNHRKSLFDAQVEFACGMIDLTNLELFEGLDASERQASSLNQSTHILRTEEEQNSLFSISPKEWESSPIKNTELERLVHVLNQEEQSVFQAEIDERMAFLMENLNVLIHRNEFVSKLTLNGALKVFRAVCPLNDAHLIERIEKFVHSKVMDNTNSSIITPKRLVIDAVCFFVKNRSSSLIIEDVLNYLSLRYAPEKLNPMTASFKPIDVGNQLMVKENDEVITRHLKKRLPKKFFRKTEKSITDRSQKSSDKGFHNKKFSWHNQKMLELYFERGLFREGFLNISKKDFSDIIWQMLNTQDPYLFELLRNNERPTLRKNFIRSLSKNQSKAFIEEVVEVHYLHDFRLFTRGWDSLENLLGVQSASVKDFEKLQLFFDFLVSSNATDQWGRFRDMFAHMLSSRGNDLLALVATSAWKTTIAPSLIALFNSFDSDNEANENAQIDQLAVAETFETLGALSHLIQQPLKNGDLQTISEESSNRLLITLGEGALSSVASQIRTNELESEFTHSELMFNTVIKLFVKDPQAQRVIMDEANSESEMLKSEDKRSRLLFFILKFQLSDNKESLRTTFTEFSAYLKEVTAASDSNLNYEYLLSYFSSLHVDERIESESLLENGSSGSELQKSTKSPTAQDYSVEQKIAALEFYAKYGFLPWWSETNTFKAFVNDLIRHKSALNHHLTSIISKLINEHALVERILNQETKETINLFGLFLADFDELNSLWIKKLNRSASLSEDSTEQKEATNSSTEVFENIYRSDNDDDIKFVSVSTEWLRPLLKYSKHLFDFNMSPTWWRFEVLNFARNWKRSDTSEKEFFQQFFDQLSHKMEKDRELEKMNHVLKFIIDSSSKDGIEQSLQTVCTEQMNEIKKVLESKTIATERQNEHHNSLELIKEEADGLEVVVQNAGIILVWPFLNHLFTKLSMLEAASFKDDYSRNRAAYLLQYLVFEEIEFPEYELTLNKILCGIPSATHLTRTQPISSSEEAILAELLDAFILNWKSVSNSSHAAMKETFFRRQGSLKYANDKFILTVEKKGVDVLLTTIPWNFTLIKLPWMSLPLHIVWRNEQ